MLSRASSPSASSSSSPWPRCVNTAVLQLSPCGRCRWATAKHQSCNWLDTAALKCSSPTVSSTRRMIQYRSSREEASELSSLTAPSTSKALCKPAPVRVAWARASSSSGGIRISTPSSPSNSVARWNSRRHQDLVTKSGAYHGPTRTSTLPASRMRLLALSLNSASVGRGPLLHTSWARCRFSQRQLIQTYVLVGLRPCLCCQATSESTMSRTGWPQACDSRCVARPTLSSPLMVCT
mmetsp:Transcript_54020/g.149795  ORF Transcript_54020/g.149795 Transcript_54020/m.149795 type:complete len:237 (-) Transcript_54020:437-1147(-)